ncbi:MAG TPA: four-helix bundle copper-binding protein [Verrucomicrobiae bacterium]|nr:four-helix bundle copper-binding protein [Verrucomicrobiae bacterium]
MMHEKFRSCIEACNECAATCEHCASACLQEHDVKMMTRCINLDRDCARICSIAVGFMASGSQFAEDICRVCAEICRACGEECRRHQVGHCQDCADACERCAEECEKMASVHAS